MNKGINCATGDVIGILNSDDLFNSENIIRNVVKSFNDNNVDALFGDLVYVNRDKISDIKRNWCSSSNKVGSFVRGWHPPHPTLFIKRIIYKSYGKFDLNYPLAADFELMLRFLHIYKISYVYLPEIIIRMRLGGETNKSFKNILKQNLEILKVFKKYHIRVSPLIYIYQRLFPKV